MPVVNARLMNFDRVEFQFRITVRLSASINFQDYIFKINFTYQSKKADCLYSRILCFDRTLQISFIDETERTN